MPGFRGINLRSGDLAEQLGILLLQNVALISPIPRTEDVGIDVVGTLIRSFDSYKYIAEDSFFVQIKSSTVTEITFKDEQIKWLSELELPFFIATVDRKTSELNLYCAHYLSDVLVTNRDRKEITFELTNSSEYDCCDVNESIKVPIGPCIISWSLETIGTDNEFLNKFYQLLKSHIKIAKKSIETRRVGVVEIISWETGRNPRVNARKIKSKKPDEIDEISAPYFHALIRNLVSGKDMFTLRSLYRLLETTLEQNGHFVEVNGKKELKPFSAKLDDKD